MTKTKEEKYKTDNHVRAEKLYKRAVESGIKKDIEKFKERLEAHEALV